MIRSAGFSECGRSRYGLSREWNDALPAVNFVMLNPSTADADTDDPTIRKCVGFAKRLGFGKLIVTNLFSFRATDPADLRRAGYPVDPRGNLAVTVAAFQADTVICAWGANARGLDRPAEVLKLIREAGAKPMALAYTHDGIPRHPLYLSYLYKPELMQ